MAIISPRRSTCKCVAANCRGNLIKIMWGLPAILRTSDTPSRFMLWKPELLYMLVDRLYKTFNYEHVRMRTCKKCW